MLTLPLRKELFWDVDLNRLDAEKNARLIIERVFRYGTTDELKTLFGHYGRETITKEILQAGYLDKKTLSFASMILNIPKEKFRCYNKMRSPHTHWT